MLYYKRTLSAVFMTSRRIETAIQRFAAKRNMDTTKKHMFDKYLIHGGIEAGPKMFSGGETLFAQTSRYIMR